MNAFCDRLLRSLDEITTNHSGDPPPVMMAASHINWILLLFVYPLMFD